MPLNGLYFVFSSPNHEQTIKAIFNELALELPVIRLSL